MNKNLYRINLKNGGFYWRFVMNDNYTTIAILKSDMETVEEICLREGWKKSAVIHNAVQFYYKEWNEL